MRARLDQIVVNSQDPLTSARFWGSLLDADVTTREGGWVHLEREGLPRLAFQPTDSRPDHSTTTVHLDIEVEPDELDAAITRAEDLGASRVGDVQVSRLGRCQTLRAPDGVVLCLVAD